MRGCLRQRMNYPSAEHNIAQRHLGLLADRRQPVAETAAAAYEEYGFQVRGTKHVAPDVHESEQH